MIDKNYPLTKEILKKIFSVDIVIEHLGDEYIDLFKWIEKFNLNVKDLKDWGDDDYLKSSEILINAFLEDIDSIELTPELLNEIALCTRYCFDNYVYDNKNHYHMRWNSVFTDDEEEWFPLDDGTPLAEAFGANGFYMLICHDDFYFSESLEQIENLGGEIKRDERSMMSDENWLDYFPDANLDELFG